MLRLMTFLIQRLKKYDDEPLMTAWYLSPELATLSLFSHYLSSENKAELVQRIKSDRGSHLLPESLCQLQNTLSFFQDRWH